MSVAGDGVVSSASVSPERGFTDSAGGVRIAFRIAGSAPADVTIKVAGAGQEVRRIELSDVQPGIDRVEKWDGLSNGGRPVADGTYRFVVAIAGGGGKEAGTVVLHRHFFPVRGPHGTRGPVGDFGAPRDGGRRHKGFDVTGRCGTPLAAAVTGVGESPLTTGLISIPNRILTNDRSPRYLAPRTTCRPGGKTRLTMEARRRLFATRSPGPR